MPVLIQKPETMSSSQFDLWTDDSLYVNMEEDDWNMKFLDMEQPDTLLSCFTAFDSTNMDFSDILTAPPSPKPQPQIRNHDCMWSGTCVDKSHPSKRKGVNACHAGTSTLIPQSEATKVTTEKLTSNVKTIMTPSSVGKCIKDKVVAGRSLLINPRVNTNTAPTKSNQQNKEVKRSIDSSSKDFDSLMDASINGLRPDTPLSLGDDVPDFKHNIDLTPCPSGNRMKFTDAHSQKIINTYRKHLEDSVNDPSSPFIEAFSKSQKTNPNDLNDILTDITYLSDYEELADDSSNVDMDEDIHDIDSFNKYISPSILPTSSASSSRTISHHEFISDHSYTRPKGSRYDPIALGVQTPSDSEEEIDVVNISEKNLPTNPSARDRRALQTTVAHKIARSKQSNQRRRVSDDDSISSSTSTLSSKGSTPIKIGSQTPNRYILHSRKRKDLHDSHKKYRYGQKKQRLNHSKQHQKVIDPDEQETIEKRNLHNNMERQRRIGLKNLFEELKCQIPSLKDKERAPKVNILREAANYCTKLRRDEDLKAELIKKNNRLLNRIRNLKASIAAQHRRNF